MIEELLEIIREDYPNIEIAGFRNGYFEESHSLKIAKEIHKNKAEILFFAFSSPKKEYWIHNYLTELPIPFAMGVSLCSRA